MRESDVGAIKAVENGEDAFKIIDGERLGCALDTVNVIPTPCRGFPYPIPMHIIQVKRIPCSSYGLML